MSERDAKSRQLEVLRQTDLRGLFEPNQVSVVLSCSPATRVKASAPTIRLLPNSTRRHGCRWCHRPQSNAPTGLEPHHPSRGPRGTAQSYPQRPEDPGHYRVRNDVIDTGGSVTLRHNSRLHHIGPGTRRAGTPVTLLVDDLYIRVIGRHTGELIRELTLDPTRDYQPRGLPPGPQHEPKNETMEPARGIEPLTFRLQVGNTGSVRVRLRPLHAP